MNEDFFILLLYKRLKGEITQAETQELEAWLAASPDHVQTARAVEQAWELSEAYPQPFDVDLDKEFSLLQNRIAEDEANIQITPTIERQLPKAKPLPLLRIAAAIAVLLVAGTFIWSNWGNSSPMIVESTTAGEVKALQLPDGTIVTLNENSSLTYPESFDNTRPVILKGEAFFDVKRDETKPFTVSTTHTITTVLGTSFNINEEEETTETVLTVKSGKVSFGAKGSSKSVEVTAGQMSKFTQTKRQLDPAKSVADYNALFWKTGEWYFNNVAIRDIATELKNRFDVELKINKSLRTCTYTSTFKLDENSLQQALNNMAMVFNATLEVRSAQSYQIVGGSCN
jgi:ferric-dicitrate binding protein FerR (iron transport regulator)